MNYTDDPLKIVIYANSKFKLSDFFKEKKIYFQQNYHSKGWTHKRNCPFPDHKETSPSFFFNPQEERFHCFGCNRSGRIVQFISALENKSPSKVAVQLIENINDSSIDIAIENYSSNREIEFELFDFFEKFAEWQEKNPEKIIISNNLMEAFEVYLKNNLPKQNLNLIELKSRINFCFQKLKEFECLEKF